MKFVLGRGNRGKVMATRKGLTHYCYFDGWDQLLNFMYVQLELDQPPQTKRCRKR